MELDPTQTAVVVVDMQNDFAHPDGALFSDASADAIAPITTLIDRARDAGVAVAYTRDVHTEDQFEDAYYFDEFDRWGEHVLAGTWGAELVDELTPQDDEAVVTKHTYDAFAGTELDEFLTQKNVNDLIICGTLANVCVLHTASSAALNDYRPIIVSDAVGYLTDDHKDYALDHADWLFGETAELADLEFC